MEGMGGAAPFYDFFRKNPHQNQYPPWDVNSPPLPFEIALVLLDQFRKFHALGQIIPNYLAKHVITSTNWLG